MLTGVGAYYCSKQCQKDDWKRKHKHMCKPCNCGQPLCGHALDGKTKPKKKKKKDQEDKKDEEPVSQPEPEPEPQPQPQPQPHLNGIAAEEID